jgi:hypothetical protein
MKERQLYDFQSFSSYRVRTLSTFLATDKYSQIKPKNPYVVLDYDGVIYEPYNEPQLDRLRALKKLTETASTVEIVTRRMAVCDFFPNIIPFFPEYHSNRLKRFFSPAKVLIKASLAKFSCTDSDYYADVVGNNEAVVFVGSGIVDGIRYKKILADIVNSDYTIDLSHVTVISTGHIFL